MEVKQKRDLSPGKALGILVGLIGVATALAIAPALVIAAWQALL